VGHRYGVMGAVVLHNDGGLSTIVEVSRCSVKCHGLVLSHLLVGWAKMLGHAVVYLGLQIWVYSVGLWCYVQCHIEVLCWIIWWQVGQ